MSIVVSILLIILWPYKIVRFTVFFKINNNDAMLYKKSTK